MNLIELFLKSTEHHKVFSFIGMAKNVGKTTTYNYIIKNLESKFVLGLTSIGRDGENKDILTNQPKPKIHVSKGTFFATAEESLERSELQFKILLKTEVSSPLGRILLVKALGDGNVELSGPSIVSYLQNICTEMRLHGVELILIDGAFDRQSSAAPKLAQATILSTGAALSHDMEEVIRQTKFSIEKLSSPPLKNQEMHFLISDFLKRYNAGIIEENNELVPFKVNTSLNATDIILEKLSLKTKYIVIKGILSTDLIKKLIKKDLDLSDFKIIIEDGTKIFTPLNLYKQFYMRGGKIEVLHPINIIAVTANPVSPYGFNFNQKQFLDELRLNLDRPVFDVVNGG
jgi:hypothetical protein